MPHSPHSEEEPPPLLRPEEGLQIVLQATTVLEATATDLLSAQGLLVAKQVYSEHDVPPFANSAMDGFAVRAADTAGAAPETPVELRVIGQAPAGEPFTGTVGEGEAVEIMTGAPMPAGADAVVRVEDTSLGSEGWDALPPRNGGGAAPTVQVMAQVAEGVAVRAAGADTERGSLVAEVGQVVTPGLVGLLASCGVGEVSVYRRPRVALLVSGDEVIPVEPGATLAPGQIFDSNSLMLRALLASWGVEVEFLGRLPDDPAQMKAMLERGLEFDHLVTVGGVSMGRHDYMRQCLAELGMEELFWKLNQQPGGPLLFGRRERTLVFGLPGNPVSCYFCAELYLQTSLRRAIGHTMVAPPVGRAVLMQDLTKRHGKSAFLRAKIGTYSAGQKRYLAAGTTGPQDSNIIRSVVGHQGYIVFPGAARSLAAGSLVEVIVTDFEFVARMAVDLLDPGAEKGE